MRKVFIYKLTVDDGGAPCVRGDILSLAICKPRIRFTAERDSILLGFAANCLHKDNRPIYVARVTKNLSGSKYFWEKRYAARPDCIYVWRNCRFERKPSAKFHSRASDLEHDLGEPPLYSRAKVLLSEGAENYRYFADRCQIPYKNGSYPHLTSLVESLGQGHRVNFLAELRAELDKFLDLLWRARSAYRETRVPEIPCGDQCSPEDDDFAECEC
jgi:hypothetical protein